MSSVQVPVIEVIPPGLKYLLLENKTFLESRALTKLNTCSKQSGDCKNCPVRDYCLRVYSEKVEDHRIKFKGAANVRRFIS